MSSRLFLYGLNRRGSSPPCPCSLGWRPRKVTGFHTWEKHPQLSCKLTHFRPSVLPGDPEWGSPSERRAGGSLGWVCGVPWAGCDGSWVRLQHRPGLLKMVHGCGLVPSSVPAGWTAGVLALGAGLATLLLTCPLCRGVEAAGPCSVFPAFSEGLGLWLPPL